MIRAMAPPLDVFCDDALAGRVALITGGGTGVCRGIAAAYARFGAEVCIVSRKQAVLDATAAAIAAETGRTPLAIAADVRDPTAIQRAVHSAVERFGKLDTVVNGAAGNFLAPAASLSPNGFRTIVDIDLNGTFNTSRASFEALQRSGDALILNISATLQYHGTPMQIHASAAKAGVDAITLNLAVEWGMFGIRVCGIAPGPVAGTEGTRRLVPHDMTDKITGGIPVRRFGTIDEIAATAVFLRSSAASYITGHTIVVDGGYCVAPPRFGFIP